MPAGPGRLSLISAALTRSRGCAIRVRVELELAGRGGCAEAEGVGTESVELRLAADATLAALRSLASRAAELELVGIKRLQAFDASVVLAALRDERRPGSSLIGAMPVGGNVVEGAALAVLHAASGAIRDRWLLERRNGDAAGRAPRQAAPPA
ncbi:MAG: hypothetical protein ACE5JR_09175 [Gemmatimonadota bacterium]